MAPDGTFSLALPSAAPEVTVAPPVAAPVAAPGSTTVAATGPDGTRYLVAAVDETGAPEQLAPASAARVMAPLGVTLERSEPSSIGTLPSTLYAGRALVDGVPRPVIAESVSTGTRTYVFVTMPVDTAGSTLVDLLDTFEADA